ncbi:hypothetical protein [Marinicella litoralis]|uniref:SbsA Ig-like domain-containing protein n=1 Tax=Marinicella litoralis TaxID=644220 RepID=A0A4R6XVK5_9GAMM|nr:hypothetical protein [Marinicella litoralis]TDR22440.1 hypothetical protein C8D91_0929 [Marinicella litoralis]
MSNFTKNILLISWVAVLLTACGGSSDSGGASPGPVVSNLKFTVTPAQNNIPSNTNNFPASESSPFLTSVSVNVTFDNGTAIPNGTAVQLSTTNASVALISPADDSSTVENELELTAQSVSELSSGGNVTFYIHSGATAGNVNLTASAVDPTTNRTSSFNFQFTVTQGPEPFDRLTIEPITTTLPANVFGLSPRQAFGTVYMTEATISFRDPLGNFINPVVTGGDTSTVGVAINPVSVAAFSTLDDPETQDDGDPLTEDNETFILLGQGPVDMVAGKGTIFIWSNTPGTATITVNAFDEFLNTEISQQVDIIVDNGPVDLPTSISLAGSGANYVNGSGGSQSQVIQVLVESSSNFPVPNPNGFNNVMIDISTDSQNSGEKITGVNASGQTVSGQSINLATGNGVASFQLLSGSNPNTVFMTATTDRADNNVDNGLQDPITAQNNFIISDGVLFGLDITSPNINSLFVNTVDGNVLSDDGIGNLDGSYTMTVSAIGTDKGGNPALPQTIQFGLIDSPIEGYPENGPGSFIIAGLDGDPEEGGSLFTSASGEFQTAAGGTQPGDTLLVFGEEILGNEDLESSSTVQTVLSQTSLRISERFNNNDLTGTVNNSLGVVPYIVGRAVDGNINATGVINENGVVTTQVNYPVSKLGKIAGIYAKGQGATTNGTTRVVTDVELILYPGIASLGEDRTAYITAAPSVIPANSSTTVTVCVFDAASHPIQGVAIQWAFIGGSGSGSIDGVDGSGIMDNRTGADGCATGLADATGIIGDVDGTGFVFNAGSLSCINEEGGVCIEIGDPGAIYLSATPQFHFTNGLKVIDLHLFGGNGQGIPNVPLFGSCESTGGTLTVTAQPGNTDENGMAIANVNASLSGINEFFTGTCTFTTGTGEPEAIVEFTGYDLCDPGLSPNNPPACTP